MKNCILLLLFIFIILSYALSPLILGHLPFLLPFFFFLLTPVSPVREREGEREGERERGREGLPFVADLHKLFGIKEVSVLASFVLQIYIFPAIF